ncbi:MAG: helix-turn-helix transcriptional regulator [Oscillospiraceae bacterium]|nr:helix-turn-helix transcriptional regulator [Oscillospiraceae bacterium]MBQ8379073.1 helix-turn-helix transcriptional regulator [Oscillospiraceae bacterium]MBQ8883085.1 helix-turn-helix transcriptional regulator [Oscillospiraceae bacterium]
MREWLKNLREEKEFTQQFVADKLGISKQYYQMIEAHERQKKMDITLATKISVLFDVPLATITKFEAELTEKIAESEKRICS